MSVLTEPFEIDDAAVAVLKRLHRYHHNRPFKLAELLPKLNLDWRAEQRALSAVFALRDRGVVKAYMAIDVYLVEQPKEIERLLPEWQRIARITEYRRSRPALSRGRISPLGAR